MNGYIPNIPMILPWECSVMTMLMMLAFLIDQVQQLCCKVYQKARKHAGRLTTLFERVRALTGFGVFNSWQHLLTFIGDPTSRPPPPEEGGFLIA